MDDELNRTQIPKIMLSVIFLGMLTLVPWVFCTLFVLAFAFDAPGSTSDPATILSVLLFCSYPVLVFGTAFLGKSLYKKKGKLLFPIMITSFPTVLSVSLFSLMIYAVTPDPLKLSSFADKQEKKFIKTCAYGNPGKLKAYLKKGLNPNLYSERGMNPLLASYIGKNIENFETLLKNGADPNVIPNKGIRMNVAGFIVAFGTEDWRKDGVPYIKMLFKYNLNPNLSNKYGNLAELAYNAREKEYMQIFKENGADFTFAEESLLAKAIMSERWQNALFVIKNAKTKEILGAAKYLGKNIDDKQKLNSEDEALRQKLIDEYKKRNINPEEFYHTWQIKKQNIINNKK